MSDTSAFIAGCATTGAAALVLLLARLGVGEPPTSIDRIETPTVYEDVIPVPAPPPVESPSSTLADEKLMSELQEQQALTDRLENQISRQDLLIRDLESRVQKQQQETQALASRLSAYEGSMSSLTTQQQSLTTQQQQFEGIQRDTDKAQSSLLWVGAGLVMVVLIGGAVVLIILVVIVAFQSRGRSSSPTSHVIYTTETPVPPNIHYRQELLPPAISPARRVYPQDVYD